MAFHKTFPKKADVFIAKRTSHQYFRLKPLKPLQIIGILIIGSLLIFDITTLLPSHQANASVKEAENANVYPQNGDNQSSETNTWARLYGNYDSTNQNGTSTNFPTNNTVAIAQPQIISPEPPILVPTTTTLTSTSNPEPQQFQPIQPIPQNNQNNIAGISAQIVAEQQQISGFMQRCVQNSQLMANQIITLKNQQKRLQNQLDAVNNQQQPNFDTSTPQGQQQQQAWQQQQQQQQQRLKQQIDNLGNAINTAQNNMGNGNGQCQQQVGQLEQQREQFEGSLDDAFNKAMNIQIPD